MESLLERDEIFILNVVNDRNNKATLSGNLIVLPGLTRRREAERKLCIAEGPLSNPIPLPVPKTVEEHLEITVPAEPAPPKELTWIERAWYWLFGRSKR